jgi:hypothetical protein
LNDVFYSYFIKVNPFRDLFVLLLIILDILPVDLFNDLLASVKLLNIIFNSGQYILILLLCFALKNFLMV